MRRLDDREQRYAYIGVGVAAFVSVALWAPRFDEGAAVALSGIGMFMALLLAVAAKRRHRLFTGLACILLAFGPWGMAWVVGLPYLMLAAWLSLKSRRLAPLPEPELDENGEIVRRPAPVQTRPRRRRGSRSTDDREGPTAPDDPEARRPPSPSKRYTPPQRPR